MKKQILILTLLITSSVFAQDGLKKGTFYGGATFYISSQKSTTENKSGSVVTRNDPNKYSNWNFSPEASYFVIDNLSVGARIGMFGNKSVYTTLQGNQKTVRTTKSMGPSFGIFARKFWNCTDRFYTFAAVGIDLSSSKGTDESVTSGVGNTITNTYDSKYSSFTLPITAGFAYQIVPNVMLLGNFSILEFYSSTSKTDMRDGDYNQTKNSGVYLDISNRNVPFNLGFLIRLNGGKTKGSTTKSSSKSSANMAKEPDSAPKKEDPVPKKKPSR